MPSQSKNKTKSMAANFPQKQGKSGYKNPPQHTQFKPGQSDNPGGIPKGTPKVSVALMKLLAGAHADTFEPKTRADKLALALYNKAMSGDVQAIREIADRTEGKSPSTVNINKGDARAQHYKELAARMVETYGKPLKEVVRDIVELEPEVAQFFEGWTM